MTENPFRDLPGPVKPYSSPPGDVAPTYAMNPLLAPAIVLLILSSLTLIMLIVSLPGQILRIREIDTSAPSGLGELLGALIALVGLLLTSVAVIAGSIDMLRLKNHRSARVASIVAIVPICSPCFFLGIPFGIWALVVLGKPGVKQLFK